MTMDETEDTNINNKRTLNGENGTPLKKQRGGEEDINTPKQPSMKPVPQIHTTSTSTSPSQSTTATSISKNTIISGNMITASTSLPPHQQQQPQQQQQLQTVQSQAPSNTTTSTSNTAANSVPLILSTSAPPSPCQWYQQNAIHDIEKVQMSEFFTGRSQSKTPEVYKEYRDFMINTYQQNPHQYLTLTAVRRNLVGDVCAIMRVHSFLDHWGLINYFVNPDGGACIPPPTTTTSSSASNNSNSSNSNTATKTEENHTDNTSSKEGNTTDKTSSSTTTTSTTTTTTTTTTTSSSSSSSSNKPTYSSKSQSLDLRNNVYGQPYTPTKTVCSTCGGDCSALRYQRNQLSAEEQQQQRNLPPELYKVNLCSTCFANKTFLAANQKESEFTKIEQDINEPPDEWSDQETLLLLEGIDIYGDSWIDVADHVGTKTKEQCLLHFLRLPIEDNYLEDNLGKQLPQQRQFNNEYQTESNIMSLIGFLTKSVSPAVASAASKAAYDTLNKIPGEKDETKMNIQSATAATLAATSIKAKSISMVEEKEIQSLILKIVNLQTKKLELKLKYYADLEDGLDKDRVNLEKARQLLFAERLSLLKSNLNNPPQTHSIPTLESKENINNGNSINSSNINSDEMNI